MSDDVGKSMNNKSLMIIILLLASVATGCLQKDTDLPDAGRVDKEVESTVPIEDKDDGELEKTVPIEYYVDEDGSWYPYNFSYGPSSWLSKYNVTEEEGNGIVTACIKAFEENAERLAREVPTKIPEHWVRDEVQLKKEDFFMERMSGLKKVDDKVVLHQIKVLDNVTVNYSAFSTLLSIYIENECVYNLKEKKVEKIRVILNPDIQGPFG